MLKSLSFPATILVCSLAVIAGCGTGQDRSAATTKATATVPADANKATSSLDQVVMSLKSIRDANDQNNLKKLFANLQTHANGLESTLADVEASSASAVAAGKDQIEKWHKDADTFTDADLRKASSRREGELRKSVDELSSSRSTLATVGTAYRAKLAETLRALDLDLSQQGVKSVNSIVSRLINDEPDLRSALTEVAEKSQAVNKVVRP